jgi:hypothetical protein
MGVPTTSTAPEALSDAINGLSWLAVDVILSAPVLSSRTSHAHPLPKRAAAAALNCAFIASADPKASSIAAFSSAEGPLLSVGPHMAFQKKLWFQVPPALLRTTVATSAGSLAVPTAALRSAIPRDLSSGNLSTAPLRLLM